MAFRSCTAAQALRAWIERSMRHARRLAEVLDADPAFEVLHRPQLSALWASAVPRLSPTSTRTTPPSPRAMRPHGRVYLAPAVDGRVCLRVCFVNFRTTDEQVDDVVSVIRELGDRLAATR